MEKFLGVQTVVDRAGDERQLRVWSDDGQHGHLFIEGIVVERIGEGDEGEQGKWRLADQGGMCSILA